MLTIPAPPPTEQRYLGIRDLVMGFQIPAVVQQFPVLERPLTSDGSDLISLKIQWLQAFRSCRQRQDKRCSETLIFAEGRHGIWHVYVFILPGSERAEKIFFFPKQNEKRSETRNAIILESKLIVLDLAIFKFQVQNSSEDAEIPREIWPSFGGAEEISNLDATQDCA